MHDALNALESRQRNEAHARKQACERSSTTKQSHGSAPLVLVLSPHLAPGTSFEKLPARISLASTLCISPLCESRREQHDTGSEGDGTAVLRFIMRES